MPERNTWALIAAAAVAVVSVTAAVFVVVGERPTTGKKITGTTAQTPGLAWSLDAAEYLGRPFADFSDPRGGASFNSGTPGVVLADNTIVTIAGVPNDGYALDDAVMLGIDAEDGTVRWKAPASDLEQCSGELLDGKIYCVAMNDGYEIVTYDVESGESARRSVEESVFGLTTTSDTLYIVEGSPEEDEVRVHSGTFGDVSANWSRTFKIGAAWEEVFGNDILTVTNGVGLVRTGNEMSQFDAESGIELWNSGRDCVYDATLEAGGVVVQSNTDCEVYNTVSEQLLRGSDGRVLATAKHPARQGPTFEPTSDADDPVLLGDSAYDRTTGDRLWTNSDLVGGDQDSLGTVAAVVDGIVYLRDPADESATGLDLRTGKQLWHNNTVETFAPVAVSGSVVVGGDGITLTAFDVSTGKVVWTAPFVAIDSDPETFSTGNAVERYGDGWIFSSDRRMIGLAPL